MANQLKMAKIHSILTLREQGWSFRQIAGMLGIHRETAARYVHLAEAGANPPPGSTDQNQPNLPPGSALDSQRGVAAESREAAVACQGSGDQNRPNPPPGFLGPPSLCEPFREVVKESLERGLSYQRIWQDLRIEHGFEGSYDSVKRFARRLNGGRPLPFRRMECEPGAEAQVDFGTGAPVLQPNGKRRRPHAFRIILSHSRKAYSKVVWRQTTENFIRCLENAFWYFGGVPKTLVIDNLKAAVKHPDWYDPDLNPKIQAFSEHYGTVILPTKPRMPRHKGKVEGGVGYVQRNGLKGLEFNSLAEENRHLQHWETTVADTRIHGTTRKQVKKAFEEAEQPALLPLPATRFQFFHEAKRSVHRDGHVEVDKAYYSVPPEYLGRKVWVRWDGHTVRIYDHRMQQIALHLPKEPGRFSTQNQHIAAEKISAVERGATWLLDKVSLIGPHSSRWAEAMLEQRGIQGVRVLQGLRSLSYRHPCDHIEQACEIALSHGAYRLRDLRQLIKRRAPKQESFEFMDQHPIIRSLTEYDQLVHNAFIKEPLK